MYILCLLILDKIVEVTNDNIKFGWFYKPYYIVYIFINSDLIGKYTNI